ncbi:hypothetical protein PSHT_07902 [Puccinia striiformis]|uniref:Homologous-pairing protein 2 winged helix domain-containing protein n=1 Tax=Puccinia striiformis TaxID=27350 RepID=A0A2S4VTY3_9BASI|nr:hypothetical protein PSHT_07902 [Puccinia striiformis]
MAGKVKNEKIDYIKGAEAETKISANLRVIKKADTLKCLTYLHESQKIDMKLFGKQAVYCCKQSSQDSVSPEVLKEMQTEQDELKNTTKQLKEDNLKMKNELAELEKLPPTAEIPIVKNELKQTWIELQSRLAALGNDEEDGDKENKAPLKTSEEVLKLDEKIEKYKALWLSHRKKCKQAIRVIQDVMTDEEARSNFKEEIGLEDDPVELSLLEQELIQSNSTPGLMKPEPLHPGHTSVGVKRSFSGSIKV